MEGIVRYRLKDVRTHCQFNLCISLRYAPLKGFQSSLDYHNTFSSHHDVHPELETASLTYNRATHTPVEESVMKLNKVSLREQFS